MKTQLPSMSRFSQAILLTGLAAAAAPASAVEYWLRADTVNVTMPGGVTVPMWGYALTDSTFAPGVASVPGPALTVPPGDPVLTIHLKNSLPEATSIVIPGQVATMTPVWDNGMSGARPSATARVRSFTHEAPAGGTADYTWSNVKPGTYLYHSGTHPQVQVQMGLYGGTMKNAVAATAATPAEAYAGVPYNNEVTLLYSEIDPALHAAVAGGAYGTAAGPASTLNYQPKYFLINGKPYAAGDPPLAVLPAGQKTLLRFLNAGLQTHVPVINGQYLQMIAEDGNAYPWPGNPRQQYSVLLPAAKTVDAILTPQLAPGLALTRYPIYDRRLNLNNAAAQDGGMLAMLQVSGGGGGSTPAFTSTPVLTATQGQAYAYRVVAGDPDGGPLTFTLDNAPPGMKVVPVSGFVARVVWKPTNAQVGTQNVTVRATDPTGLSATQSYSIAVANVNDAPVAKNDAYVMIKGGTLVKAAPGVLANDSDPDVGDTLTAMQYTPPLTGTFGGNAQGRITYVPPAAFTGVVSFTYRARDNNGLASALATGSITVRNNRAPVALDDTVSSPANTVRQINVLANDSDPDTAIDPANRINPATVLISSQPNMGGTATVNANGTISYTPKLNFTGTEVFMYRVRDTYSTPATSKAVYVRVNVQ